jgi:hypothetical protein
MECGAPSQPLPIPPRESLNIEGVLEKTRGSWGEEHGTECVCVHRAKTVAQDFGKVKGRDGAFG